MRLLLLATGLFAANVVVEAGVCKPARKYLYFWQVFLLD